MRVAGLRRWLYLLVPVFFVLAGNPVLAQDDILDEIEAELRKEAEQKKAQAKADKNKDKNMAIHKAAVSKGDAMLRAKKYDDAIESYQEAIKAWPADAAYPEQQINKAREEKKAAEEAEKQAELEAEYKTIIAKADAYFKGQKYAEAIASYQQAASVLPDNAYPQDQINEAKKLQAKQEEERKKAEEAAKLEKAYTTAMAEGDAAMKAKDFETAIGKYEEAGKLKPSEAEPKSRKATAEKMKADEIARLEQEKIKKQYDDLISEADGLFKASSFDQAKAKYEAASKVLPNETYPKTKMKECDDSKLAAEQAKLRSEYDALIKEADALLKAENFDGAISKYEEAGKVLPHENHPKDMITQAQNLKTQKAKDELLANYNSVLKEAEDLLHAEKFDEAIAKLKEAHKLMPEEGKTNELIAEAERLKQEKAQKAITDSYEAKLKEGEDKMHAGEFDAAIEDFKAAKTILPSDHRADNLIEQVKSLKADKEKQALLASFNEKIEQGEEYLKENRFDEAEAAFIEAQKIMPNDPKPKSLLVQVGELRAAKEKEIAKQEYDEYMSKGDAALEAQNFEEARTNFKAALSVYAEGQSSVDARLQKVNLAEQEKLNAEKAEAEAKAKQEQYESLIAEAESKKSAGEFDAAMGLADKALLLFPNDDAAKKLKEEAQELALKAEQERQEKLAAEAEAKAQAEKEAQVAEFLTKADGALSAGELNQAKNYISSALAVIPDHEGAKQKQAEVESAIEAYEKKLAEDEAARLAAEKAEQEKKDQIDKLISEANSLMASSSFAEAISKYDEVLAIDASNGTATSKKAEAQQAIADKEKAELAAAAAAEKAAQEKAKQDQIESLINSGNQFMDQQDYTAAKSKFQEVLAIDAGNSIATSKIAEADNALKALEEQQRAAEKAKQDQLAAEEQARIAKEKEEKIASLEQSANSAEREGSLDIAISIWNEILALDNAHPNAQSNIDRINNLKKEKAAEELVAAEAAKKKAAAEELKRLEEEKAEKIAQLSAEAETAERSGDLNGALSKWKEVLALESTSTAASSNISRLDQKIAKQKQEELAAAEAEKQRLAAEEQKRKAEAEKLALADRNAKIEAISSEANAAESNGELDVALGKWNEVVALDAENTAAVIAINRIKDKKSKQEAQAAAAAESERKQQEELAARQAEQEKKNLIASYIEIGDQILADKQFDKAIENYNKVKEIDPNHPQVEGKIARAQELKDAEEKRIAQMEAAERQQEIAVLLSDAKLLSIKRKYKEAETKYNKVLEYESDNERAKEGLASIQSYLDQIAKEEAEAAERKRIVDEKKRQVEAILDDGADLYAGGKYDEAIDKYKEGLKIDALNGELKSSIRNANQAKERAEQYRIAKLHNLPRPKPEGFKTEKLSSDKERKDKTKFQNVLGKAYPEGVTEEVSKEKRKELTRRVVVKEGKGTEFYKVRHDWGGVYYFKNGESITPYLWQYGTRSPDQITN